MIEEELSSRMKWLYRFVEVASLAASWSKNRSHRVGAALYNPDTHSVLGVGYNGMVQGMDDNDPALHDSSLKHFLFEHGERNALYQAAAHGIRLEGAGIAVTWFPCADCARGIVRSRLSEVVCPEVSLSAKDQERWGESFRIARQIFEAGGVRVIYLPDRDSRKRKQ